ncbi:MAG: DUF2267 domain-containing protein [Candidatus Binataceae bacterium]
MDKTRFINQVAHRACCDVKRAEAITFVVFQELRERITAKEALDVASQLPVKLRSLWLEGERPGRAVHRTHATEFIGDVRRVAVLPDDAEAERAVKAVFATLQDALGSPSGTQGEAWDVFSQLPKDLKILWLGAHRAE